MDKENLLSGPRAIQYLHKVRVAAYSKPISSSVQLSVSYTSKQKIKIFVIIYYIKINLFHLSFTMAQQQPQDQPRNEITNKFREIELLKKEPLGVGSYGSVYKAKCDHLLCAAKIIHPTLVSSNPFQQISPQREHRLPIRRFEMECDLLKEIRHPNIIQYLGMYQDPETDLPVLLMELMDESLTHFLESSTEPISYHIQVNLCLDIVQALSFLHLNGIIHRDLSSNNVLLIGKGRAKLTDFGMARLVNISTVSNTECPGTNVCMPPEAIGNQPVYTEKGDVFSFGVNIIQILTRKFPKPGDRFKTVTSSDPQFSSGRVEVRVSEIERRNNDISEIDQAHPLLSIALNCLKDQESERPSVDELYQRITALKDTSEYIVSKRAAEERESILLEAVTESNSRLADKVEEIQQLRNERDQLTEAKDMKEQAFEQLQKENEQTKVFISARQRDIQDLREELSIAQATVREREQQNRDYEEMIAQFQRRIEELELNSRPQPRAQSVSSSSMSKATQPKQLSRGQSLQRPPSTRRTIRLNWTKGGNAPRVMFRSTDAVVDGSMAYFRPDGTGKIYSYHSITDMWSHLPDCPPEHPALTTVSGLLITVGGYDCNLLFSFTGEGSDGKWTEVFPPMTTKRSQAAAVCTGNSLIVAGGMGLRKRCLTTVEIMNTDTQEWSAAADLPRPLRRASATICDDIVYVLGAVDDSQSPLETVYSCSLSALHQTCHSNSLVESLPSVLSQFVRGSPWSVMITDLPVTHSTCVTFNDQLLVIGGTDSEDHPTTAVRKYDPVNNSWHIISYLSTPRRLCFAVVLPENKLMIVGGYTSQSWDSRTDSVEFASV